MNGLTLRDIQHQISDGQLTVVDLVTYYLKQVDKHISLNAYVQLYDSLALAQAKKIDNKVHADKDSLGKLYGLVVSVKDVIAIEDRPLSASSKILDGYRSPYSATVIERLVQEDAILIGHTSCDEFGMGSSNEHAAQGPVRNLDDPDRVPGGSSGGAAVSVQMDSCLVALGSDTGGSVRQPASWCGLIGYKPSYGSISRHGLVAYTSSMDQIGLIGRHMDDIRLVMEVISGPDQYDASCQVQLKPAPATMDSSGMVYFNNTLDHPKVQPAINAAFRQFLSRLKQKQLDIKAVEFDLLDYVVPCYYVLSTAEASSNLSRYDGMRYGAGLKPEEHDMESYYRLSRTNGFGIEVKRRIMMGTFVLSAGYYDAYYTQAQKVRQIITTQIGELLSANDYIVMPTTADIAWPIGALDQDPVAMYMSDIFTVIANLAGLPAISIPLGRDKTTGMSFGVQIVGSKQSDFKLLSIAKSLLELA